MSADNWTECPRCLRQAEDAKRQQKEDVDNAYGKIAANEWKQLLDESEKPIRLDQTLREDYGIGLDERGRLWVKYRAHCCNCDFAFEFSEERSTSE